MVIRNVSTAFQFFAALHVMAIPVFLWVGIWWLKKTYRISTAMAFGISATVVAFALAGLFLLMSPRSDRGMGIILLLVYPLIDAALAVAGILTMLIHSGKQPPPRPDGMPWDQSEQEAPHRPPAGTGDDPPGR